MTRRGALACRQLVELITDYLEDALTPAERVRVEDHLSHCGDCAAYLAQMRCLIALARDGEQDVPASTEAQIGRAHV